MPSTQPHFCSSSSSSSHQSSTTREATRPTRTFFCLRSFCSSRYSYSKKSSSRSWTLLNCYCTSFSPFPRNHRTIVLHSMISFSYAKKKKKKTNDERHHLKTKIQKTRRRRFCTARLSSSESSSTIARVLPYLLLLCSARIGSNLWRQSPSFQGGFYSA